MLESPLSQAERQQETLNEVLSRLTTLHRKPVDLKTDGERIVEGMSSQIIGPMTLTAYDALVHQETVILQHKAKHEKWDTTKFDAEVNAMSHRITIEMFKEHWFESTLSTVDHPIHSATYGASILRYDLRMLMTDDPTIEKIQRFGWVMFDVDGLRSFKDCTSHEETTRFLREIVCILTDHAGPTQTMIRAHGIRMIPMATGGDEFVLYLQGKESLTQTIIDAIVTSFQKEVSESTKLRSFLDYNNYDVLMTYGMPSAEKRYEFEIKKAADRKKIIKAIREDLPDTFTPSIAGGGMILDEAMLIAVDKDKHDLQGKRETFQTVREKIVQALFDGTERKQKKNKDDNRKIIQVTNPKLYKFWLRNSENREQERKIAELEAVNRTLAEELALYRQKFGAVLGEQK